MTLVTLVICVCVCLQSILSHSLFSDYMFEPNAMSEVLGVQ